MLSVESLNIFFFPSNLIENVKPRLSLDSHNVQVLKISSKDHHSKIYSYWYEQPYNSKTDSS